MVSFCFLGVTSSTQLCRSGTTIAQAFLIGENVGAFFPKRRQLGLVYPAQVADLLLRIGVTRVSGQELSTEQSSSLTTGARRHTRLPPADFRQRTASYPV